MSIPLQTRINRQMPLLLILGTSLAALFVSIISLLSGWLTIFQNLFYIPIFLACIYYTTRGFFFSVLLSCTYFVLMLFFSQDPVVLEGALIRVLIFVLVAGVITYISTGRMHAEEALRQSERNYRDFFTTSRDSVFITSPDGRWIDFNDTALEMFGYSSREELMALPLPELYEHPEQRRELTRLIDTNDYVKEYPARLKRKDGRVIDTLITSVPLREKDGSIKAFTGTIRDVTDRKRVDKEIEDRERFLQQLLETISNPIFYKNQFGIYIGCNSAFTGFIGIPKEQIIGKSVYELSPKDLADIYYSKDKELLEYPGTQTYEAQVRYADGSRHDVIFNKATLVDAHGNVEGLVGVIIDITKRKRAEEALMMANRKLNLLGSITRHDILNQLMVVNGYLELLHENIPDPALENYFNRITDASARIGTMIQFSKSYEQIGVNAPVWQDCHMLVGTAAKEATLWQVSVKNDLPAGTEVFADPLIVKVFYNLIDNAVRHGEEITTIRISGEEHGEAYHIIFVDNGVGIPADEKEKIFDRGHGKNTGFGLFLAREILGITGITIIENGEPVKGARFEIMVPKGTYRLTGTSTGQISR